MFEDSLVESAALLRSNNRWPAMLSLGAQLIAAAVILSLPLLHPESLPLARSFSATLAPPRSPAPPPPPVRLKPQQSSSGANSATAPTVALPAHQIFRNLLRPSGPPVDAPPIGIVNLGAANPALPAAINTAPPTSPHVHIGPPAIGGPKSPPIPISSGVSAGLLLAPIRPDYPSIARLTRTEGTVIIEAIISRDGTIESAHILSGPTVFQQAALNAVRQARYRPFLLNGQPTEVQTTITIRFRSGS